MDAVENGKLKTSSMEFTAIKKDLDTVASYLDELQKASKDEIAPIDLDTCEPTYKVNAKMRFTPQSFACFASHMKKSKHKIKIFFEYFKSFFDFRVKDGLFNFNDSKPYFKYIQNLIKNR